MERASKVPTKPLGKDRRQPVGPIHWVHGEHPERSRPKLGEEPPRTATEPQVSPERLDR